MKDEKTINGNDSITIKCDGLLQDEYTVKGNYEGIKFGPELEFFTVDKTTFKPKDCLDELAGHSDFGKLIKPELPAEQIEITSLPSESIRDLEESLAYTAKEVISILDKNNACLLPISLFDTEKFTITPEPRYQLLIETLGPHFKNNAVMVASDQINVGARNEKEAFEFFNSLRHFLPLSMALSASSPFKNGRANGVNANRLDVYDAAIAKFPDMTGIPPRIESLKDYARELESLPVFQHPNMYYKYVRPMPHRGVAAELRHIDKQHTLNEFLGMVALTKAAVQYGGHDYSEKYTDMETHEPPINNFLDIARKGSYLNTHVLQVFNKLARSLNSDEIKYLKPISQRLVNDNLAEKMVGMEKKYGLDGTYRRIAEQFKNSIK